MKVTFRKSFTRDLQKITDEKLLGRVEGRIGQIESAATLCDISDLKKLVGAESCYRIRVGEFRIGLIVRQGEVQLVRFLHRRDLYRHFP